MDRYWQGFKQSLLQSNQETIYLFTRHHLGSYLALLMSIYNLYHLRQKIIKNTISITKSNSQPIVKIGCMCVGGLYWVGLYSLWHIPSIATQVAVRIYYSSENAMTNYLLHDYKLSLLTNAKLQQILQNEGLSF